MTAAAYPDLEAMMQGYVEGSLQPDECATLLEQLRQNPALAEDLLRDLQWDQFIRDTVKSKRMDELLRADNGRPALTASQTEPRSRQPGQRATKRRGLWIAVAAAAMIALAILLLRGTTTPSPTPIAQIGVTFHAVIERNGARVDASAKDNIFDGDTLRMGPDGSAAVVYADGTRAEFTANSVAQFGGTRSIASERASEKKVFLDAGELTAVVAPQSTGQPFVFYTPQAKSVVVGTVLTLAVARDSTRLDVAKGRVRITSNQSGKSVDVSAGEYALAAPNVALQQKPVASKGAYPTEGLAGAWDLNSSRVGGIADISNRGNGGNAFGEPTATKDDFASALRFDGSTQYVELEKHGVYDDLARGTLMAWIRCGTPREGRQMTIFGAENDSGKQFEFSVKNGQLTMWVGGVNQNKVWTDSLLASAALGEMDAWHHVAYVVSDKENALYIDGVRAAAAFSAGSADQPCFMSGLKSDDGRRATRYRIAASIDTMDECFHGSILEVRVYDRPLSAEELRSAAQTHTH
jgi:ferric-dicitrate binding protein FerR (iron transport regulator)